MLGRRQGKAASRSGFRKPVLGNKWEGTLRRRGTSSSRARQLGDLCLEPSNLYLIELPHLRVFKFMNCLLC